MKQFDAVRLILTTTLSDREIADAVGLSKTTVGRYRRLVASKRLEWDKVCHLSPADLRALLNRPRGGGPARQVPDLAALHELLQTQGMTLQLWWEDYRRDDPHHTLSYSQLAARLRAFRHTLPSVMRQHHKPGERVCVDYSGVRPHYFDADGNKVVVELFVGVLPASSLMFALCTRTQRVPDFIEAHVAMLDYFGGVPQVVVPDNLKSAVITPGKRPTVQRSYADFARHYGMIVMPTRPHRPRDKASVEASVKVVQQRVLARLRHQRFCSLNEINAAISALLDEANGRPMVKDGISRRGRFEAIERAALGPLPASPYAYADWTLVPRVPRDYHVCVEGHFYSVPHGLIGKRVEAKITQTTIEVFHERRCVAHHARAMIQGGHTTDAHHQPEAHRAQAGRTPEGMLVWAKDAGIHLHQITQRLIDRPHPMHALPACDDLKALVRKHGESAVDQAARQALALHTPTVTAIKRLLANTAKADPAKPRSTYARGARSFLGGSPPC